MVAMWLILSLAAVLMFTAQNLLMRVLAVKSSHPRTFSFIFNSWGAIFSILLFFIDRPSLTDIKPLPWIQLLLIGGAVLGYGLYERSHFLARKHLDASTTAVLFRLSPVIAFVGSLLFLHEPMTLSKVVGAVLLISASLAIVHKNPQLQLNRSVGIALFSATMLGLAWMLDKPASVHIPASIYTTAMWILPLPLIAFPALTLKQLATEFRIGGWKVALTAFLNVLAFFLYLKALAMTDASRVIPIVSSSATLVVLGGVLFLHERTHLARKLIAGALMLIGILLLR